MSIDLTTRPSLLSIEAPEKNPPKMGPIGTFGDVDPNYSLSNAQCRAIDLAQGGHRLSQNATTLNRLDRTRPRT